MRNFDIVWQIQHSDISNDQTMHMVKKSLILKHWNYLFHLIIFEIIKKKTFEANDFLKLFLFNNAEALTLHDVNLLPH